MPDYITHDQFVRRFPVLVLDQRTLPRRREAIITLLVGAMVEIDIGRRYTEAGINAKLEAWVDTFGGSMGLDHVAIRRMLVDEGYLHRNLSGTTYVLRARSPRFGYEWSIRSLDLSGLVEEFEQQRAERRDAYASHADERL